MYIDDDTDESASEARAFAGQTKCMTRTLRSSRVENDTEVAEQIRSVDADSDEASPAQPDLTNRNGCHLKATAATADEWNVVWPLSDGSDGESIDQTNPGHSDDEQNATSDDKKLFEGSTHQPPWLLHFPLEHDSSLVGFNRTTALKGGPKRRLRSDTHNGQVQRLPERDGLEASSESGMI
jgi:hypothetical protein